MVLEVVHKPVLLRECLTYLAPDERDGAEAALMIDATLGEGGHTEAFLKKFEKMRIIGLDSDPVIQARAKERLAVFFARMSFHTGWFNDFFANYPENELPPDVILFDLGISVYHYELSERGFSFRADEPLDMRLHPSAGESVAELIARLSERELADLIYLYGEERYSRRIARAIEDAKKTAPVLRAAQLAELVFCAVPENYRHGKTHPATKTFQALRIAVNAELKRLPEALTDAFGVLRQGGKLGVITFHSLEDRMVKNFFRGLTKQCVCPPEQPICVCGSVPCAERLTFKAVQAQADEIAENPPSRSAKLRVIRKLRDMSDARARFITPRAI